MVAGTGSGCGGPGETSLALRARAIDIGEQRPQRLGASSSLSFRCLLSPASLALVRRYIGICNALQNHSERFIWL